MEWHLPVYPNVWSGGYVEWHLPVFLFFLKKIGLPFLVAIFNFSINHKNTFNWETMKDRAISA